MAPTTLTRGAQTVRVDAGELVSYRLGEREYVHQKGSPGWRSADTEMFPVIGPTAEADFRVETPRGAAVQDQHGLLRELAYARTEANDTRAVFEKTYAAGTPVPNSKYPAKSTAATLTWPYAFRFRKTFSLEADGLRVAFEIDGEPGMPYMLGYHPAFRLTSATPRIVGNGGAPEISLDEVLAVGSRALHVPGQDVLEVVDGEHVIRISAPDFGGFMCWTEVRNMVCVEPITFYPYDVAQGELATGLAELGPEGVGRYEVRLEVGKAET